MYIFKPVEKHDLLLDSFGCSDGVGYIGYEGDKIVGKCHFVVDGYFVEIKSVSFDEDKPDAGEGLIRSALGYAGNRNAYIAKCNCENAVDILKLMGFEYEDGTYSGDIPTLLGGSCGCCR